MTAQNKIARRNFFMAIGFISAGAMAAKVSGKALTAQLVLGEEIRGDSYRLTEHVRKYYRTTTI
jgi:glycine/D-amino acid oxidase-like deaminating enzyme